MNHDEFLFFKMLHCFSLAADNKRDIAETIGIWIKTKKGAQKTA
jgi:hypothetical protein